MDKLERSLGGIKDMALLPDALFVIDVGTRSIACARPTSSAFRSSPWWIPTARPMGMDYPIPGNDDAMRAIQLYTRGVSDAVLDGKASVPQVAASEDDFVELDEAGPRKAPRKADGARGRGARPAPAKAEPAREAAAQATPEAASDVAEPAAPEGDAASQ
jgi:small subunit ribosomal protein S2